MTVIRTTNKAAGVYVLLFEAQPVLDLLDAASAQEMPLDGSLALLPSELACRLLQNGKRGVVHVKESAPGMSRALARAMERGPAAAARQRTHTMSDFYGVDRGPGVQLVAAYGRQPNNEASFLEQTPAAGGFVATRKSEHSALQRVVPELSEMPFWVWRILRVISPGDPIQQRSGEVTIATGPVYEAQLFLAKDAATARGEMQPCWEIQSGNFLRTEEEKHRKAVKKALFGRRKKKTIKKKDCRLKIPLTAFLRPENLVGGGFSLTPSRQIPAFVRLFLEKHFQGQS